MPHVVCGRIAHTLGHPVCQLGAGVVGDGDQAAPVLALVGQAQS